jgi:quercetin dioxygenase-like cupin family protein
VSYPPGGKSPAHHHAQSAFIYAYVLQRHSEPGWG